MSRFTIMFVAALCVAGACKDDKGEGAKTGEVKGVAATGTVPDPLEGKESAAALTIDRLLALETSLKSVSDWTKAEPEILASIGPATRTIDNQMYWAAVEGEDCAYVRIDLDGTKISLISWAKKFSKGAGGAWTQCMKAAGQEPAEAPAFEKKVSLAEVSKEDIEAVAKQAGWGFESLSGMGMGSLDSHKLTFKKEGAVAEVSFVRPNGKKDDPKSSMKITPAAQQARGYEADGAAFVHSDSMIGIRIGTDQAAAAKLLGELKAALLIGNDAGLE